MKSNTFAYCYYFDIHLTMTRLIATKEQQNNWDYFFWIIIIGLIAILDKPFIYISLFLLSVTKISIA